MTSFLIITIYLCSACSVGSVVVLFGKHISIIVVDRYNRLVRPKYIESVSRILSHQSDVNLRLPNTRGNRSKLSLIVLLSHVTNSYSGYNRRVIEKLIDIYNLDTHLAWRTRMARGIRRALYIQMASRLPIHKDMHNEFGCYERHHNRHVRLSALLHNVSRQPEMTPQILEQHPYQLTDLELRQVVNCVAASQLPLSMIRHLLGTANHNMQFVGLELAQLYGSPELFPNIKALVGAGDKQIYVKAVQTLVKLHCNINEPDLAQAITAMRTHQRKKTYRLCISEGYSLHSFDTISSLEEDLSLKRYIVNSIVSYKKSLAPQYT